MSRRKPVNALLDTSVVIAGDQALNTGDTTAISVVTIGELRAGVLLAGDLSVRAARQARLSAVREVYEPLPVDEAIAEHYGDVLAGARKAGRITTATDLIIIATALATGRSLHTLDDRQARLAEQLEVPIVR